MTSPSFRNLLVLALITSYHAHLIECDGNDRVALVIGNSNYADQIPNLPNASSDSELIANALIKSGFQVTSLFNLTTASVRKAIDEFSENIPRGGDALFFFAGHGFEVEKEPSILGTDAAIKDGEISSSSAIQIEFIIREVARAQPRTMLFFFDSCRELIPVDPEIHDSLGSILGPTTKNFPEMLISFSSEPGGVALDGQELGLPNSPYSKSLAIAISEGFELGDILTKVRREVFRISGGRQRTWDTTSMVSDFFFTDSGFTLIDQSSEPSDGGSSEVTKSGSPPGPWEILKFQGREYVSTENIGRFFQFEKIEKLGDRTIFTHPMIELEIVGGSQEVYVNSLLFYSSFMMPQIGDSTLVSTLDLAKLIDPVIRPSKILHANDDTCQFAFLFDENRITREGKFSIILQSYLSNAGLRINVLTSASEKERAEWLREQSEEPGTRALYIRLDVPGLPSNGIRAMTIAPQGSPQTGDSAIDSLQLPVVANHFDRENIALATALYSHLCADLKSFRMQELGVGRTLRSEMRAINCPAALIELGRPSDELRSNPEALARSIVDAAIRFKFAVTDSNR